VEAWLLALLAAIALAVIGLVGGYAFQTWLAKRQAGAVALNLEAELARVEAKQRELIAEARRQASILREEAEAELRERRDEVRQRERRLQHREEIVERRAEKLDRRDEELRKQKEGLDRVGAELAKVQEGHREALERISQLNRDEARKLLGEALRLGGENARSEAAGYPALAPLLSAAPGESRRAQ